MRLHGLANKTLKMRAIFLRLISFIPEDTILTITLRSFSRTDIVALNLVPSFMRAHGAQQIELTGKYIAKNREIE